MEEKTLYQCDSGLHAVLRPRSIAVVGASRQQLSIGGAVLNNLIKAGFRGSIFPINSASAEVQGLKAYRSVLEVPGSIELGVICVPAAAVLEVAEQCGEKGVKALVVISSGFSEVGGSGVQLQRELVQLCKRYSMRLVGPNCMGVANTAEDVRMNATFAPITPPAGRISLMTQSGAVGLAIMDYAASLDLGVSGFVSVGNKADVSSNDLLEFWEKDAQTDLILLYLESFGNPRRFATIAPRVARTKPIIAVKSGRSLAGARAASSHTGALLGGSDRAVDALLRQCGVIRTATLEEMFGVASILAHQPVPSGRRVAIVTNAGGPGIMCADACDAEGLVVPQLSASTQEKLRAVLPAQAGVSNPVDMIASATPAHFAQTISLVAADENVDALIVIYIPPLVSDPKAIADSVVTAVKQLGRIKPVITVFMSHGEGGERLHTNDAHIPSFLFPETAVTALAHAVRHGEWLRRPVELQVAELVRVEPNALTAHLHNCGADGWLTPAACCALLDLYGIKRVKQYEAATPAEAAEKAELIGGAIALKGIAPGLLHKSELGAVRIGISGSAAVLKEATEMIERISAHGYKFSHFVVQEMAQSGIEMIIGSMFDEKFGPVVVAGAGGVLSELISDLSVRLPPISINGASAMLDELRSDRLLKGFRGAAPCNRESLQEMISRLGSLVHQHRSILEVDLNPVIVTAAGAQVVDCRIRVASER